jgi:transposase
MGDRPVFKYMTKAEVEEARVTWAKMYVEGRMSIREISVEVGRGYATVHRILTMAGVTLRPRGGDHKGDKMHRDL